MATLILPLLVAVLVGLAVAACLAASGRGRAAGLLATMACGIGALACCSYLVAGAPQLGMASALLLPGGGLRLGLDGLGGWMALLTLLAGTAASAGTLGATLATGALLPALVLGMILAVIAADTLTLMAGFELMSLVSLALVLSGQGSAEGRPAGLLYGGMAGFAAVCCVVGLALLSNGAGLGFAAIRAHPAQGWRAGCGFLLLLAGAGSMAGLVPLHVWLPPAHGAAPAPGSALMSGAMTKVSLYVLIRAAFDLAGPATPGWWGAALLAVGAASAVLGALRANLADEFQTVLACSTIAQVGLVAVGLGFALMARALDLPGLASLALAAALLHAMAHALSKTLLFLAAGAVQQQAGSRRLDQLGGLMQRMPVVATLALLGGLSLAALPPSAGFASEWLLFQTAFAASSGGGLGWQLLACLVALAMATAAALAVAAAVRLLGMAFLGRPRTPRGASAQDAPAAVKCALAGLAAALALLGLLPGLALGLLDPTTRRLVGAGVGTRVGWWTVAPQTNAPGYPPLLVALLLALAAAGGLWLLLRPGAGRRAAPAWDGGFAPSPAWLPFGDPLTQYGPDGFAQPIRRALAMQVLSVAETVHTPAPGDPTPARITVAMRDPAARLLFAPAAALCAWLSAQGELLHGLSARRALSLLFVVLVLMLAAVVAVEQW